MTATTISIIYSGTNMEDKIYTVSTENKRVLENVWIKTGKQIFFSYNFHRIDISSVILSKKIHEN